MVLKEHPEDLLDFQETDFYAADLPNIKNIGPELVIYRSMLEGMGNNSPNDLQSLLDLLNKQCHIFPNILKLVQLALVLPVTSCEAECSFSTLRRLTTWLRSTMSEQRLASLARMCIHQGKVLTMSIDRIVNVFVNNKGSRICDL